MLDLIPDRGLMDRAMWIAPSIEAVPASMVLQDQIEQRNHLGQHKHDERHDAS